MLTTYRAAFRAPGSFAFCAASFVMRFPIAIYPIALVLLVSLRTGHYGFAGVLSGCYVVANGVGNPVLARLVDRHGQGRMLLPATAVHLAGVAAIVVLALAHAPDWTLVAPAVLAGFCFLAVTSLVRARWSYVLAGRPELSTAYSLESTLDEVMFTTGPLLATVIATQLDPVLVFVLAAALVAAGAMWLRPQRATEPPVSDPNVAHEPARTSALRRPGVLLLTIAAVGMGAVFASSEVTMIAFCGQHGKTSLAGAVIACVAFGSATAGFFYGARHHAARVLTRFRRQALIFALLPVLFLAAVNVGLLGVIGFVVGLGIAPMLITSFGVIEDSVPTSALTEGMAWLTTGLSIGYGVAAALVGNIADAHGARPAFGVTIGAGLLMGALALVLHRRLSRWQDGGHAAVPGRGDRAAGAQAR